MAGGTRDLLVRFLGDAAGLKKATADADAATDKFSANLKSLAGTAAAAYATKQIIEFGKASVEAAAADEASQVALATALRNTVGANAEVIASTEAFIGKMQDSTGTADDVLRPAFARLVTSTRDVGQAQTLMSLAMDISAGTGKDLGAVAEALGKANDGNVSALKRLGLQTTDAEGKTLSFEGAVKSLSATFGGQADAAADTNAGKMKILKARYGELQETVGKALLPILEQVVGVLSGLVGWFSELDEGTQAWIVRIAMLGGGLLIAGRAVSGISDAVKTFSKLTDLASKAAGSLGTETSSMGQKMTAAGLLGIGLGAVLFGLNKDAEATASTLRALAGTAAELSKVTDDKLLSALDRAINLTALLTLQGKDAEEELIKFAAANLEGARRTIEYAEATGQASKQTDMLKWAIAKAEEQAAQAAETTAKYADATDESTDATNAQAAATKLASQYSQMATAQTLALADAAEGRAAVAIRDLAAAEERSNRALAEWNSQWDTLTGKLNDQQTFLDLQQGIDDVAAAGRAAWEAQVAANDALAAGATDAVAKQQAAENAMRDFQGATISTKQDVINYGQQIGLLPDQVSTLLKLIDNGEIERVERQLQNLARNRTMNLSVIASGAIGYSSYGGKSHSGGTVPGSSYSETMMLLQGGERVLTREQQATAASSFNGAPVAPTINVVLNVGGSVRSDKDLVNMIYDGIVDGQRRGELVGSLA